MTTEPIESHAVHSRRMLDHAAAMLAQGDRLQASEKIWGAAAHRLKENRRRARVAQRQPRRWLGDQSPTTSADQSGDQADLGQLIRTSPATRTRTSTRTAYTLPTTWRIMLDSVIRDLLSLLDDAHRTLPPELPMPDDRHYRNRHR